MRTPTRVLVLGGGFVAVHACRSLYRASKAGTVEVTVVTRENALCMHGLVAEMVTGRVLPGSILNPARRIFPGAHVRFAEVESIDLDARRAVATRNLDGARLQLDYDTLVVAVGTGENLDAYPGLHEHAFKLRNFEDCFALRNHVVEMFELAELEDDPEERRRLLTFVVAGGGYSGTELAGELADLARLLTRGEFRGIARDECRVVIVHPGPTLLPELYGSGNLERRGRAHPRLVEYGMHHIRKLGVELRLETAVTAASPADVFLSDGTRIPTRTIVSTVGTKALPLVASLPVAHDAHGRLVTDEFLRLDGRQDAWAAGDCAAVPHPDGGTCPPTALWALKQGRHVGRNVCRVAEGKPPRPFRSRVRVQGISLGRRRAVAEAFGIGLSGAPAWVGFRTVLLTVVPSWDRRVRLVADWAIWLLVGRDIVHMPQHGPYYQVGQDVYEPGEAILERRRPTRFVHIVADGEAELVAADGDGERVVDVLGPGDHFGPKLLRDTGADAVRARSLVRTLVLRADQAVRLQQLVRSAKGPLV